MGTRSLTHVQNEYGTTLVTIYRQFDGYPSGMGQDLKTFLSPFIIVNGLNPKQPEPKANGAGCLAAQLVAHLKEEPGGIYIEPPDAEDCGEEYTYIVQVLGEGQPIRLQGRTSSKYREKHKVFYDGPVRDFDPAVHNDDDPE